MIYFTKAAKMLTLSVAASAVMGLSTQTQAAASATQVVEKAKSDYAKTKYPILMVHGWLGWQRIGTNTIGLDYWYQILPDMARNGSTVFAAQLSPANTTAHRGEQLIQQVEDVLAITGKPKLNLIGHSHGGPTVLYVAQTKPHLIASITGVAGTYHGSKVADDIQNNRLTRTAFNILGDYIIGPLIALGQLKPELEINFDASMKSLTQTGSKSFNATVAQAAVKDGVLAATENCNKNLKPKDSKGIYYYSWTGVAQATNVLDIDTILMQLGPLSYNNKDNDGMVSRCSAYMGKVINDNYKLNHTDLANMMFGLTGLFSPDPVAMYRQHANRLKLQGL
ncbi:alpha/beta fold hydrolase [Acinetobacter wanghuae]|uniref:Alpha/beta fold hydrolase n=1 Tax=Acinetobacter wanghuae TaxID=2662362 RepID=A0A5Q0P5C2_9GAMM|nr:triacylglycerol lipase [Acinetobacter wanghuae]MQW92886.1 alpha/beta fold hydrolase [Acinetobacter wanghuae]QGA11976.1 alpha/beta fold hydrolase [Acinetobacter wanghuae]